MEKKKVHLINWETVGETKQRGGLGIQCMRKANQALLAKASWRLMKDEESLWSKVISCKYIKGRSLVDAVNDKGRKSCVWRGIFFWNDNWVPNIGILREHSLIELDNQDLSLKVESFLWRCAKIFDERFCMPIDIRKVIYRIVKEWNDSCKGEDGSTNKVAEMIYWQPPANGWVKINVDGSMKGKEGAIAVGGGGGGGVCV
ncbi:hypothetical protein ACOSQ2_007680 [Xanthoceras sorbifolium]